MSKAAALRRHKECRASIKPRPTVANVKVKRFWKPRRFWKARPKCVPAEDLEQAGYVYREDMLDRWTRGALSNIDLCTTAWKHTRSGGRGTPDLGINPASKGQNHARAARRALGLKVVRQTIYFIMLPIWDWDTQSRVVAKFPIRLPHELLAADFLKQPTQYCMKRLTQPITWFLHIMKTKLLNSTGSETLSRWEYTQMKRGSDKVIASTEVA